MLLLTEKLLVSINEAVTQVSAVIRLVSTAVVPVLTITVSPYRTHTILTYSFELHILALCTGDGDQDVVLHIGDAIHESKAQEFGVATHMQPVQWCLLLYGP